MTVSRRMQGMSQHSADLVFRLEEVAMNALQRKDELDALAALPEGVPVPMPELPLKLVISTIQQFKAVSDPIRMRILGIIQNRPATAKQIADQLRATPGTIGHH